MIFNDMQKLSKHGLLYSDKIKDLDFCENCIFGKAHRIMFDKGMYKSKIVLDYIHSNLYGPAQIPSMSGGR